MAAFDGADGTRLAYRQAGVGRPLICVPGGPMQASAYLGDLGGLSAHRSLVLVDLRGTGASAVPADPASYRVIGWSTMSKRCAYISGWTESTCWDTPPVRPLARRDQSRAEAAGRGRGSAPAASWTAEDGSARSAVEVVADELGRACGGPRP